jgi:hypothetical protein
MNTTQIEAEAATLRAGAAERAEIASTIIEQINRSDRWARARWGVKEALALGPDTRGVQFNCTKRIKIIIKLDADDTYSIEIGRLVGRFDYAKRYEISTVYAGELAIVIDRAFSGAFGRV